MRYDLPRGFGLLRAVGGDAGWWLAATLLALQRFAWPRVTAIRTLRHGADLGARTATES